MCSYGRLRDFIRGQFFTQKFRIEMASGCSRLYLSCVFTPTSSQVLCQLWSLSLLIVEPFYPYKTVIYVFIFFVRAYFIFLFSPHPTAYFHLKQHERPAWAMLSEILFQETTQDTKIEYPWMMARCDCGFLLRKGEIENQSQVFYIPWWITHESDVLLTHVSNIILLII